mgnify:CR=1 FL=1
MDENTLVVSATLDPHSKILEEAAVILDEKYGIDLDVKVLDDYYIFNEALNEGEVDANYFQHIPYLEEEIATRTLTNGKTVYSDVLDVNEVRNLGSVKVTVIDFSEIKESNRIRNGTLADIVDAQHSTYSATPIIVRNYDNNVKAIIVLKTLNK